MNTDAKGRGDRPRKLATSRLRNRWVVWVAVSSRASLPPTLPLGASCPVARGIVGRPEMGTGAARMVERKPKIPLQHTDRGVRPS